MYFHLFLAQSLLIFIFEHPFLLYYLHARLFSIKPNMLQY